MPSGAYNRPEIADQTQPNSHIYLAHPNHAERAGLIAAHANMDDDLQRTPSKILSSFQPSDRASSNLATVQAPLMLDSEPVSCDRRDVSHQQDNHHAATEWIPIMLRPIPVALLLLFCIGLVLGLELLNDLPAIRYGIPTDNSVPVQVVTYLPIVLVVLLGIAWKRLVVDLKRVVPWACLSQRWTVGRDSLELNYLDDLEMSFIWPSAKRRHWALLLGLLGGLVSGALGDTFDPETANPVSNSSLTLLKSFLGNMPWAGAANVLQDNRPPAWTTDSFVFAPFHTSDVVLINQTVTANTTAVTGKLLCDALEVDAVAEPRRSDPDFAAYNIGISTNTSIYINLTESEDSSAVMSQIVGKDPDSLIDPPVAWLNMSSSPTPSGSLRPLPILLTLLQPVSEPGPQRYWNGSTVPVRAYRGIGLSCTPVFYSYTARVSVNGSNGIVSKYVLDNRTSASLDIMLASEDIIGYLNNPLHPETIFGLSGQANQIRVQDVIQLGGARDRLSTYYTAFSGSDPFGTQLLDLNATGVEAYLDDYSLLQADASRVFATIMTQLFKNFAIVNGTRTSLGQIESQGPLLKVQQPILRTMEASLAFLIITMLCCAWPLRPRTCLSEDPGSLHFIARLLAQNKSLDAAFTIQGTSNRDLSRESHFRLRQEAGPVMHLDIAPAGAHSASTVRDIGKTYEPLPLRLTARLGLMALLASYIVALGILYARGIDHGYLAESKEVQLAWSFVPTTLLVLIGYAVSGSISAVQAIAPLALLKTERLSGRRVMGFSPRNRSELTLPYHALFRKAYIPVLLSALIALAYPIVKVVGASLFDPFESPQLKTYTAQVTPAVFNFTQLAQIDGGTESRLRNTAAIRTDWVQLPELGVQSQPNVVRNLIFQNVSISDAKDTERLATTELTALAVNMTCDTFDNEAFTVSVWQDRSFGTTFGFACETAECRDKVPYTLTDEANELWIAIQFANWQVYYPDPYAYANRRFYGTAGTWFSSPAVQVMIVDLESISGPVSNFSFVPDGPRTIPVTPGMFNVSMPTMRAVSCNPVLQNVRANATIERRVQAELDGQSTVLPWAVTDFDQSSVRVIDDLKVSDPQIWRKLFPKGTEWGHSPFINRDYTPVTTNWTNESNLNDDDIRPASGIASNFFELLASYERSRGRNTTAVLDVNELAAATAAVYGLYNAELLSHFRVPTLLSRRDDSQGTQAQLHIMQARVRPDFSTVFAVVGMLSVILVLLLTTFLTIASNIGLLGKPGMISTQLSLFAGSRIVERLRDGDIDSVWDERFSLGWWSLRDREKDSEEVLRWGIDTGRLDATLQGGDISKPKRKRSWSVSTLARWTRKRGTNS